jgi:hypothetical protein
MWKGTAVKRLSSLRIWLLVAWGLALLGCGAPAPAPSFGVKFRVLSDDGIALSGVIVSARGRPIGKTNQSGELDAKVGGSEGEVVPIAVQCGSEYRSAERALPLRLTRTRPIASGPDGKSIPYDASCTRKQRNVVVVAHADKLAGIPITVDGKQVALTDPDGNAQVLIPLDASVTLLHVGFETSSRPELQPRNPGRACDVAPGDDIVTLEQKFSVVQKSVPRRFQAQPKHVPVRVE